MHKKSWKNLSLASLLAVILLSLPKFALGQVSDFAKLGSRLFGEYETYFDITYLTANNFKSTLDVYVSKNATTPNKTIVYIHGGGWIGGTKEDAVLDFVPFLAEGWSIVNIEYRVAPVSLAPAAVEDARCALRWVFRNAQQYNFDPKRIVVMGASSGGHLAAISSILPVSAGFDRLCFAENVSQINIGTQELPELKVAAIVNVFGIMDVKDILEGANRKSYAVNWFGNNPNRNKLAAEISPINYARPGLPPMFTAHGDKDSLVPYEQAVRMHAALDKVGVPNYLLSIPGADHGNFSPKESGKIYQAIMKFLQEQKLW